MTKLGKIVIAITICSIFVGCGDRKIETNESNKIDKEVVKLSEVENLGEGKDVIEELNVVVEPKIKIDLENNKVLAYVIINNSTEKIVSTVSFDLNYIDSDGNILSSTPIQLQINGESEILIGECPIKEFYDVKAENVEYNFEESN